MITGQIYVTPDFDCITQQAGIIRLAVQTDDQSGLMRQFETVGELRRELRRTGLINDSWLEDLAACLRNAQSWESPDPVRISDALAKELKLCRIA